MVLKKLNKSAIWYAKKGRVELLCYINETSNMEMLLLTALQDIFLTKLFILTWSQDNISNRNSFFSEEIEVLSNSIHMCCRQAIGKFCGRDGSHNEYKNTGRSNSKLFWATLQPNTFLRAFYALPEWSAARQWLDKHMSLEMDTHTTINELLEIMSVWSVSRLQLNWKKVESVSCKPAKMWAWKPMIRSHSLVKTATKQRLAKTITDWDLACAVVIC
jgi:hypothetical protein